MNRTIIEGDNLEFLKSLPNGSIDLIYLDPPFFSGREHFIDQKRRESGLSFEDRWKWTEADDLLLDEMDEGFRAQRFFRGMEIVLGKSPLLKYLLFLGVRIDAMRRSLTQRGSIYLHCDFKASAPLRLLLDSLFGVDCFQNEIVWCYGLGGSSPRRWPRKHDTLLWYSRNAGGHFFEPATEPATSERMKGRWKKCPDYWTIPSLNNMASERTGYPTQKPLALLERIVVSSAPPDGVVLDPFAGSGTTLIAAERTNRRWIGVDSNPAAIETIVRRFEREFPERSLAHIKV